MSQIGNLTLDPSAPFFILGPCALESEEFAWQMARSLKEIAERTGIQFIFKASYDKANRTSVDSFRGPGVVEGCRILGEIGKELGLPVTTDIHTPAEAAIAAETVDFLQIPAFLCRQTDLLEACAKTGRPVNIKKGQFLAPWDVKPIAGKMKEFNCENFYITERGSTFGYNNLVADMRSLYWMRDMGMKVIFDATHSVQRPGGEGGTTGGDGELAPVLARAAIATGVDGVFMETHLDPKKAFSDGPNQIPLTDIEAVLNSTWSAIFPWSCICPASFRKSCIRAGVQRRSKPRRLRRGPSQSANGHSGSAADTMTWSLVRRARLGPEVTHPYGRGPRFEPRRGSCSCGVAKSCRRTTALLVVGSRRTPKMRFQKTPSTVFHRFGPWR